MSTMLFSLPKFLFFALLALPVAVLAVYEDQYQEYDWQISNIGPSVDNVLFKVGNPLNLVLIASNSNVKFIS